MALLPKNKYDLQTKKILIVLESIDPEERCSICDKPLYPARMESWKNDILVDFKFHNAFCENCGLFEYEPLKDIEIYFLDSEHQEIYKRELNCFK